MNLSSYPDVGNVNTTAEIGGRWPPNRRSLDHTAGFEAGGNRQAPPDGRSGDGPNRSDPRDIFPVIPTRERISQTSFVARILRAAGARCSCTMSEVFSTTIARQENNKNEKKKLMYAFPAVDRTARDPNNH